ncbi:uncharacterized protein V1518DRAFT_414179 [Limtongia smithiae]|uniref:uncharacterized protein n=1 Tax=Limtongia smithiae TaxID=1125753 RepID=UPI0034CF46F0
MRAALLLPALAAFAGLVLAKDEAVDDIPAPTFPITATFLGADNADPGALPVLRNTFTATLELEITNPEPADAVVQVVGGALYSLAKDGVTPAPTPLENITAVRVGPVVLTPGGGAQVIPYSFTLDREPKDYFLRIGVLVEYDGALVQALAYNGTVVLVDPPLSFFDPQLLFLYVILSAIFGVGGYYVFNEYIRPKYFPAKREGKRRATPAPAAAAATATPTAETTGAKTTYDESWIPEHHLRAKSPKPRAVKKTATKKTK